jgi:uncharacterized protein with PIN domain
MKCPNCNANFANAKKKKAFSLDTSYVKQEDGKEEFDVENCPSCGYELTKTKKEKDPK